MNVPHTDTLDIGAVLAEGSDLHPAGCRACASTFLVNEASLGEPCPWCAGDELTAQPALAVRAVPELRVPFAVDDAPARLARFVRGTPMPVPDLRADRLVSRLRRVWVPTWLVDATVRGRWEAEIGFDYDVSRAQETFDGGSWRSTDLVETRIRWEPRRGELLRSHDNARAAAIERSGAIAARIGDWSEPAVQCTVRDLDAAIVRLPDLQPDDAWPEAEEALAERIGQDCARAAGGQHHRGLCLDVAYEGLHWTWALRPLLTTWYVDEDGVRHAIWIHGETGTVGGRRMASTRKGNLRAAVAFCVVVGATVVAASVLAFGLLGVVLGAESPWITLGGLTFVMAGTVLALFPLLLLPVAIWLFVRPRSWNGHQRLIPEMRGDP